MPQPRDKMIKALKNHQQKSSNGYAPTEFFIIPKEGIGANDLTRALFQYRADYKLISIHDILIEIDIDGDEPCFILSDKRRQREAF